MHGMIHHHGQALEMAALVPSRSRSKDIPLLAKRIDLAQTDEIKLMERWLEARDEAEHTHTMGLMPGMLTHAQMARLEAARGRQFDRLFLRFMIQHHKGALVMVSELYASKGGGMEPEVDAFARHVEADQEIEIKRMQELLARGGRPAS
jgi:uncharacterized protein (DUF305 family)